MKFKSLIIVIGIIVLATAIIFSMGCQNQPTGPEDITKMGVGNLPQSSKTRASFLGNIISGSNAPSSFTRYWNQVTPENSGKWGSCEGSRDQYNWSQLDAAYNFARSNGYKFKAHCLVWGQQEPGWVSGLSQSEQRAEVEEWIRDFGKRYSPDLVDVVNEPLHAKPSYRNALGGDGSTGWDWVVEAFRLANQYVSGTKILNEYDILNGSSNPSQLITIANAVKNAGMSLSIGCQAHSIENVSANDLRSRLNQIRNAGYTVYVSELEIRGGDSEQLRIYQDLFPIIWENSAGVTLWGYIQGQMWRGEAYLVSSSGSHRPAMDWLMQNYGNGGGGSTTTTTSGGYTTTTSGGYTTTTTSGGGGGSNSIVVRARGTGGGEHIYVTVGGSQVGSWTVSTSYQNYSASTNNTGDINVCFDNDDGENMDVQIDYITVNGSTRQAEDQSYNTGVWQNNECGGGDGMSEWLHCEGCIGFGSVSGGGGATTTAASTTTTASSWWGGGSWWGSTTTTSGGYTTTTTTTTTTAATTTTTSGSSWWGGGSWW